MDDAPTVTVVLPLPPSANRIWRVGENGQVHRASAYRGWLKTVGWECLIAKATGRVPGFYALRVTVPEMRKDPDNILKPTGDALQKAGVVANDRWMRRLVLQVEPARNGQETMLVEVWALPGEVSKGRRRAT
jgi:Holliday junction resolvase RusA-like endonuclease